MAYTFYPHRHVKIWLSADSDVFLNQENQLRLVKMRDQNPGDEIHLLYAENLLSKKAKEALGLFCDKHHINPVCIERDILPYCEKKGSEKELKHLFEEEIASLGQGGNLAAASDMLRWMRPVYQLGTYADFDTTIHTKDLPESAPVNAPILLQVGSIITVLGGVTDDLEAIALNNDIIAVVGDDERANQEIKSIQEAIVNAYKNPQVYLAMYNSMKDALHAYYSKRGDILGEFLSQQTLQQQPMNQHCFALASGLGVDNPNPLRLRKAILNGSTHSLNNFEAELPVIKLAFARIIADSLAPEAQKTKFKHFLQMEDKALLEAIQAEYDAGLLKQCVLQTTGPGCVMLALFKKVALERAELEEKVSPYAFEYYTSPYNCFYSDNSVPLHSTQEEVMQMHASACCDESWLASGQHKMRVREEKMHEAAREIQKKYKQHQLKQPDDVDKENKSDQKNDPNNRSSSSLK